MRKRKTLAPARALPGKYWESGKSILVEDIDTSPYAEHARRKDQPYRSLIASPIHLNGELIGVINITGNRFPRPFNIDDQNLLDIAALFIGKSIQVMQLQNVLNSRFAQMALAQQEQQALQQKFSANPAHNPDQLAKLLAKTFYRELTRAGLNSSQIISTATEIINQLNSSLSKHKKRMERQ
jgi:L-methionine (R)-S-oxide reductase